MIVTMGKVIFLVKEINLAKRPKDGRFPPPLLGSVQVGKIEEETIKLTVGASLHFLAQLSCSWTAAAAGYKPGSGWRQLLGTASAFYPLALSPDPALPRLGHIHPLPLPAWTFWSSPSEELWICYLIWGERTLGLQREAEYTRRKAFVILRSCDSIPPSNLLQNIAHRCTEILSSPRN